MFTAEREIQLREEAKGNPVLAEVLAELDLERTSLDWMGLSVKNTLGRIEKIKEGLSSIFVLALIQDREPADLSANLNASVDRIIAANGLQVPKASDIDEQMKELMKTLGST